jgi:SARP family transcriptional regulator, regulator of embCAB operon
MLHADSMVPVAALMRELWPEELPGSGVATLHSHITHLRRRLADKSGRPAGNVTRDIIVTTPGGYLLQTADNDYLDLREYEQLVYTGRSELRDRNSMAGVNNLHAALGLWRGPALADVTAGPLVQSKVQELHESRLTVLQDCAEAEMDAGLCRNAIMRLAVATAENPLNESLHMQYMRALCLDGRRAEALTVYQALRNALVGEIGLEPGRGIRQLQQAILSEV